MKVTIRQCRDWCCEDRAYSNRWWNAHLDGKFFYESAPTPTEAYVLVLSSAQRLGIR